MTNNQKVRIENIPPELKALPQWVNWKYEYQEGKEKPTKVLKNPKTNGNAQSNNPATWGTLANAFKNINRTDGIGFVFTKDDPYTGVDLDHCRNAETGDIEPWAKAIKDKINSYSESSPSETGIHCFVKAKLPRCRKKGHIEAYDQTHYFTVTGNSFNGNGISEMDGQELYNLLFGKEEIKQKNEPDEYLNHTTDELLLDYIFSAKNGDKVRHLWEGDHSQHPSRSEADMALVRHLWFWTGSRAETDRLFRQSGLYRQKWDKRHYGNGKTYGEGVLDKGCTGEIYRRTSQGGSSKPLPEGQAAVSIDEWTDLIPFNNYSSLPDFPIQALPGIGREMVEVVSEVNQVDPGMTASIYLSVLSACMAKKANVNLISHTEPVNIYTCAILPSGNRKSSTMDTVTRPLYEYQATHQEAMQDTIRTALNAHKIREARLAKLQKQAASANNATERRNYEIEAAEVAKEISNNPVPVTPMFIVDDITTEALGIHMAENNERMAVMSTEGGIFDIMAGRYSDKAGNFDLYLKAHAGDPWSCHRVGREAKTMQSPALTMCLTVQPEVIREIGVNNQFRGKGLLPRFGFSHCKSQVGYRGRQTKAIPGKIRGDYQKHIYSLLDIPMALDAIRLSLDAQAIWDEFYNDVETDMREGGSLYYLTDWGSKLPGAVARIAGLLHFAEHGTKAGGLHISVTTVTASCLIGSYFKEHALAAFDLMDVDVSIEAAKKILSYLYRYSPATFKGRDVIHHTNLKTMEEVTPGLRILRERGYIRAKEAEYSGMGRPEAAEYEVNPKIKMLENP